MWSMSLVVMSLFSVYAFADTKMLNETEVEFIAIKLANEAIQGQYKLMNVTELKVLIDSKESFVLIDAHPPNEFAVGYIDGATNFGFQSNRVGTWEKDVAVAGATQEQYRTLLGPDKNKKIVIYCGFTKCGRSHNAAIAAKLLGYTNIYRVPGGISAWKDAGYPYKTVQ